MRICHLLDAASSQSCPTTAAMIAATLRHHDEDEHHLLLLGGRSMEATAAAAGLTGARVRRATAPLGGGPIALSLALRRLFVGHQFDCIVAWSPVCGIVARYLLPETPRRVLITQPVHRGELRWLDVLFGPWGRRSTAAGTRIITISEHLRQWLITKKIDGKRITVACPPFDGTMLQGGVTAAGGRQALRAAWGVVPASDRAGADRGVVVALIGDPATEVDALPGALAVGLARESVASAETATHGHGQGRGGEAGRGGPGRGGPRQWRMLVHPLQRGRRRAQRMLAWRNAAHGGGGVIVQEPRLATPWQVLPACDVALLLKPHGVGLAARWALAAGLPIIAEDQAGLAELLESGEVASQPTSSTDCPSPPPPRPVIVEPDQPKRMAHYLHQFLVEDNAA